jgi:hypothetical protein
MGSELRGMTLQEIAKTLLEPVSRVKKALAESQESGLDPKLLEVGDGERLYDLRSVVGFVAFYRLWEKRQQTERHIRTQKAREARFATDPRALLSRAVGQLAKARADIATASKAMRPEGLVTIQFLTDARLKPRVPFMVTLSVRGAQGKTIVAELPELGLSVKGRARAAVLDRLRTEIVEMYWRLKEKPQAEAVRWTTLQQMVEERLASEK